MDYEKFHNETLRNLQEMVSKGKITEAVAKGICADFVAESKDEKIRKEIAVMVNFFYGTNLAFKHSFSKNEMLAWLEKQKGIEREIEGNSLCNGEQKPAWSEEDENIRKALIHFFSNTENTSFEYWEGIPKSKVIAWLEKQCEQKPVNRLKTTASNWYVCEMEVMNENMTTAFHSGEVYYCPKDGYIDVNGALFEVGTLDVFRLATKEEIPQPKQEWSEEDKCMLNNVIDTLKPLSQTTHSGYAINSMIAWLKSLKERVQPQPKQEWSEEDERKLQLLIVMCDETKGDSVTYSTMYREMEELKTWLKCLKERYTRKPSEEQVKALLWVIENTTKSKDVNILLNSLYEDLKTL